MKPTSKYLAFLFIIFTIVTPHFLKAQNKSERTDSLKSIIPYSPKSNAIEGTYELIERITQVPTSNATFFDPMSTNKLMTIFCQYPVRTNVGGCWQKIGMDENITIY